jgi:hypothetical protein
MNIIPLGAAIGDMVVAPWATGVVTIALLVLVLVVAGCAAVICAVAWRVQQAPTLPRPARTGLSTAHATFASRPA